VVRHREKTGRKLPPAMRAGDLRRRNTHGIERLSGVVEARREKALLRILAKDRIAAQGIVHGDVHDIAGVKTQPADGTGEFAFEIGRGGGGGAGLGAAGLWDSESRAAVRAITTSASVLLIRFQLLTA